VFHIPLPFSIHRDSSLLHGDAPEPLSLSGNPRSKTVDQQHALSTTAMLKAVIGITAQAPSRRVLPAENAICASK
jgi:hypothetical protein